MLRLTFPEVESFQGCNLHETLCHTLLRRSLKAEVQTRTLQGADVLGPIVVADTNNRDLRRFDHGDELTHAASVAARHAVTLIHDKQALGFLRLADTEEGSHGGVAHNAEDMVLESCFVSNIGCIELHGFISILLGHQFRGCRFPDTGRTRDESL